MYESNVKIIIKVRYFMANFRHKVRTIIESYLGVNATATSAADENSQHKREKDSIYHLLSFMVKILSRAVNVCCHYFLTFQWLLNYDLAS